MEKVHIIGAGINGLCCAIALQEAGYAAVLHDKDEPGQHASRWNGGVIAASSVIPLNNPRLPMSLPSLLRARAQGVSAALDLNRESGWQVYRWALDFLSRCRSQNLHATVPALRDLINYSTSEHLRLAEKVGLSNQYAKTGWLFGYAKPANEAQRRFQLGLFDEYGIEYRVLSGDEIGDVEPLIAGQFHDAVYSTSSMMVEDPAIIIDGLLSYYLGLGGEVRRTHVEVLHAHDSGLEVRAQGGEVIASSDEMVILAAGPWTRKLLATAGLKLPMMSERGYAKRFSLVEGVRMKLPVYDVYAGTVMCPRPEGVQVSTGVELAMVDTKPNHRLMNIAERRARELLPIDSHLSGFDAVADRPTLVDSLPAIGRLSRYSNTWLCAGHQHIGFTSAPGSARLLLSVIKGEQSAIDAAPYSPARFGL